MQRVNMLIYMEIYKFCNILIVNKNITKEQSLNMSKNKPKDKKPGGADPSQGLQTVVEQQKRQIIELNFTVKKLQDRISRMTEENYQVTTTRDDMQKKYEDKNDQQRIVIESHETTIQRLNKKVHELEVLKVQYQTIIKNQQRQLQYSEQSRIREMQEYKKLVQAEMGILQNQLKQYNNYMNERDDLYEERNRLKNSLSKEKENKIRDLADKQRQKVQQTDKLKDDMLKKIQQMRSNLLSLKKQQLQTTTRLAVLQNHQLTSQLQFQSKETQKLLFENENLQKKILNLQKDVEIHKEVEEQLAKRSHVSKGIIKKLTNKIAELQDDLQKQKLERDTRSNSRQNHDYEQQKNQQNQIIAGMERSLTEKQKKITKIQADYHVMENELSTYKSKLKIMEKRSYELSVMLLKYYEDILSGKIDFKYNEQDQYFYDIKALKKKPVQQWGTEDARLIVTVLLNQLRPHITKHNLGIPTLNKSQMLVVVNDDDPNETKLPSIGASEHSLLRKESKKFRQIPASLAPKLVGSNLRQWGRTVHSNSVSNLTKKLKQQR